MDDPKTAAEALRWVWWRICEQHSARKSRWGNDPQATRSASIVWNAMLDLGLDAEAARLESLPPPELSAEDRRALAIAWFEECPSIGLCGETLDRFLARLEKTGLAIVRVRS